MLSSTTEAVLGHSHLHIRVECVPALLKLRHGSVFFLDLPFAAEEVQRNFAGSAALSPSGNTSSSVRDTRGDARNKTNTSSRTARRAQRFVERPVTMAGRHSSATCGLGVSFIPRRATAAASGCAAVPSAGLAVRGVDWLSFAGDGWWRPATLKLGA
ncbi:hypothetical protein MRX96_030952 [Rhipicephalus microplus]